MAFGSLICLWDLGMSYWKDKKKLIPEHIYNALPNASNLLRHGFATLRDGFVYCNGANEKWSFLFSFSESGSKGGKASVEARKKKYGTSKPMPVDKPLKSGKKREASRSDTNYSSSSSSSSSVFTSATSSPNSFSDPAQSAGHASPTSKVRKAFQESYKQVYGYELHWGARENGQISNWLKSVPFDDALQIAKLYPHWKDPFIVDKAHPLGLMTTNTSKIMSYIKNPTEHVLRVLNAKETLKTITNDSKKELHDAQYQHALRRLENSTKQPQQAISNSSSGGLLERGSQCFGENKHEPQRLE